jgi:hypothetical protein
MSWTEYTEKNPPEKAGFTSVIYLARFHYRSSKSTGAPDATA